MSGHGADRLGAVESLRAFQAQVVAALPYFAVALGLLLVTWVVAGIGRRLVRRVAATTRLKSSLVDLLGVLTYTSVWVLGVLAAAIVVTGLGVGQVVATLGLGSIALGFAFKDIIENFFAGILILWKFPFDVGDYVECETIEGRVEDIEIRMTLIRRTDGQLVVIPNAMMFKNPVRVLTAGMRRRTEVRCGIAYGEDVAAGRRVIAEAVERCETVDGSNPVQVFAYGFGASSIDFEIAWWTGSTPLDVRRSRDEVVEAVKRALDDAGIEIPYPYRTLTFSRNEPAITEAVRGRSENGR